MIHKFLHVTCLKDLCSLSWSKKTQRSLPSPPLQDHIFSMLWGLSLNVCEKFGSVYIYYLPSSVNHTTTSLTSFIFFSFFLYWLDICTATGIKVTIKYLYRRLQHVWKISGLTLSKSTLVEDLFCITFLCDFPTITLTPLQYWIVLYPHKVTTGLIDVKYCSSVIQRT